MYAILCLSNIRGLNLKDPILTFTGQILDDAITNVSPERISLIENLLYEKSSLLLYAPDGIGKSTICLQACCQATIKDEKVFGEFEVVRPCNILYFQMERHPDEVFERIKLMRVSVPVDHEKFCLSVALQGTNLQQEESSAKALKKISEIIGYLPFQPDIIAFDPIYALTLNGLESSEACNAVTNFFRVIQLTFDCTIVAVSHANRGIRDVETGGRKGEDLYGNRFLSAFFTGIYQIKSIDEGAGTKFKLEKSSQKNLEKKFELVYNASDYCSWIKTNNNLTKKQRLYSFLKTCKMSDKEFSFEDMQTSSGLSDSPLRGYLAGELKNLLKNSRILGRGKILYKYLG